MCYIILFKIYKYTLVSFHIRTHPLASSSPRLRVFSCIRSDQISRSVMSNSLRPHESQHARPPCPLPTPGVHSDSRPSSQWCHPAISSSVVPFFSCPQSLPASESFPVSQLFAWGAILIQPVLLVVDTWVVSLLAFTSNAEKRIHKVQWYSL